MKKLSLLMASAAIILAGCGSKDEAVAPEAIDQAVQETAVEVEVLVVESQQEASAGTAEEVTVAVVDTATETVAVVQEEVTQEAAAAEPDLAQGKVIYSKNCFACHGSGAAGAPKLGDTENWAPRIAQGMGTMAEHAIGGFKGATGYMPPKGGFMGLSDEEVTVAIAYMVSESQ